MTRMEMPEPGSDAAKALLTFESKDTVSSEDFGGRYRAGAKAVEELRALGWPFRELPPTERDLRASASDVRYGTPDGDSYREVRQAAAERFRSRAYLEWREEALAALTGQPITEKVVTGASSPQPFAAADFSGMKGSRLTTPPANQVTFQLLFALMHLDAVTPDACGLSPLRFVAATVQLKRSGWPLEVSTAPLSAAWIGVAGDVLAAWRAAFGDRGLSEALEGKFD